MQRVIYAATALGASATPSTMRAVVVSDGASEADWSKVKVVNDYPVPSPGDGQMLIKVAASSINPVDWKIMENPAIWPAVPGFDVAGEVEAMDLESEECGRFQKGDGVWADLGKGLGSGNLELGAWAEYAVADCSQVGHKPRSMSFEDAASLPLVALTGLQALRMVGAPWQNWRTHRENLTVVITSGSGGTGVVAIQLAKAWGATNIITSASPRNADLLRSLGATLVVDYHESTIWEKLGNDTVDVVYDNYGAPGTADAAMPSLKANSDFIFLPGKGEEISKNPKPGVNQLDFGLCDSSKYEDLDALKDLAEAGLLHAVVQESHTLENILDVLESSHKGHAVGKIGINITDLDGSLPPPQPPTPTPPPGPSYQHLHLDKCITVFTIPASGNKSVQSGINLCDCDEGCGNPVHHREANDWHFDKDWMISPPMEDAGYGELCVLALASEGVGEMLYAFEKTLAGQFFGGCVNSTVDEEGYWWIVDNDSPEQKCVYLDELDRSILTTNKSDCSTGWARVEKQAYELLV